MSKPRDWPERPIPSGQFERVLQELRKLTNDVDTRTPQLEATNPVKEELRKLAEDLDRRTQQLESTRGIEAYEARRCFALSAVRIQEAAYHLSEGAFRDAAMRIREAAYWHREGVRNGQAAEPTNGSPS